MADLIDRQEAIELIEFGVETLKIALDSLDVTYNEREKFSWGIGLLESYIEDIKELPPAQRKTGQWNKDFTEPLGYKCSVCGKGNCKFNFCPNCGADMRGESDV